MVKSCGLGANEREYRDVSSVRPRLGFCPPPARQCRPLVCWQGYDAGSQCTPQTSLFHAGEAGGSASPQVRRAGINSGFSWHACTHVICCQKRERINAWALYTPRRTFPALDAAHTLTALRRNSLEARYLVNVEPTSHLPHRLDFFLCRYHAVV